MPIPTCQRVAIAHGTHRKAAYPALLTVLIAVTAGCTAQSSSAGPSGLAVAATMGIVAVVTGTLLGRRLGYTRQATRTGLLVLADIESLKTALRDALAQSKAREQQVEELRAALHLAEQDRDAARAEVASLREMPPGCADRMARSNPGPIVDNGGWPQKPCDSCGVGQGKPCLKTKLAAVASATWVEVK